MRNEQETISPPSQGNLLHIHDLSVRGNGNGAHSDRSIVDTRPLLSRDISSFGPLEIKLAQTLLPLLKLKRDKTEEEKQLIARFEPLRTHIGKVDSPGIAKVISEFPPVARRDLIIDQNEVVGHASIAVVYASSSPKIPGKRLVTKVIKPEAKEQIAASFSKLKQSLQTYGKLGESAKNIGKLFLDLAEDAFSSETDTLKEMEGLRVLRKTGIKTPVVYTELSGTEGITMDRIEAKPLSDWVKSADKNNRKKVAGRYLASLIRMIRQKTLHRDPHAGNVLVTEKEHLYWVDPSPLIHFSLGKLIPIYQLLRGVRTNNNDKIIDAANKLSAQSYSQDKVHKFKEESRKLKGVTFYEKLIREGPPIDSKYIALARSLAEGVGTMLELLPEEKSTFGWIKIIAGATLKAFF